MKFLNRFKLLVLLLILSAGGYLYILNNQQNSLKSDACNFPYKYNSDGSLYIETESENGKIYACSESEGNSCSKKYLNDSLGRTPLEVVRGIYGTCGGKEFLLTESLRQRLKERDKKSEELHTGYLGDPFICGSQNLIRRATYRVNKINDNEAVIEVNNYLNSKKVYPEEMPFIYYVYLVKSNGQWSVDDIQKKLDGGRIFNCIDGFYKL